MVEKFCDTLVYGKSTGLGVNLAQNLKLLLPGWVAQDKSFGFS